MILLFLKNILFLIKRIFLQDDEDDEDEDEDEEEDEEEDSESEVGEERVPTPKKEEEDLDTDQETDRLLGQQYNDDNGYYDQKVRKSKYLP